jgi:hypothetical protein
MGAQRRFRGDAGCETLGGKDAGRLEAGEVLRGVVSGSVKRQDLTLLAALPVSRLIKVTRPTQVKVIKTPKAAKKKAS